MKSRRLLWSALGAFMLLLAIGGGWLLSLPPTPSVAAPPAIAQDERDAIGTRAHNSSASTPQRFVQRSVLQTAIRSDRHGKNVKQEAFIHTKAGGRLHQQKIDIIRQDSLKAELSDFIHCVKNKKRPLVSGEEGRDALALALRHDAGAQFKTGVLQV